MSKVKLLRCLGFTVVHHWMSQEGKSMWLKLNFARDARSPKKGFHRYASQKRKVQESVPFGQT